MMTRGTMSWFFKMNGAEAFVASQKPAFIQFLKTISFDEPMAGAQTALPPGHPPIGGGMTAAADAMAPGIRKTGLDRATRLAGNTAG